MHRVFLVLAALVVVCHAACPFTGNVARPEAGKDCPHKFIKDAHAEREEAGLEPFPYAPDTTVHGCTCRSTCGATLTTGLADCAWCYVDGSCGHWGLGGHWDYCVFPTNKTYEAATAEQKLDFLWSNVKANTNSGVYPNSLGILDESIQVSFDDMWDWMPLGRKKYIHSIGAVCPFKFVVNSSSPYTGLFAADSNVLGLIRMGSALAVNKKSGVVPGLGIKFLRDKVPSGNFVALHALGPLPGNDYNFFKYPLWNHIPPATGVAAILSKKFTQASTCVTQVGLSDICTFSTNGTRAEAPVFPYKVKLVSPQVQLPSTPCTQEELQKNLAGIKAGTPLFDMYAFADPQATTGDKLGTFVVSDDCTNSLFGDNTLFFRHQRIEEDWALRPEWFEETNPHQDCSASSISMHPPKSCNNMTDLDL